MDNKTVSILIRASVIALFYFLVSLSLQLSTLR